MAARDLITIDHVPIERLHPDPANPRRIPDAELESLTRSIREFGLTPSSRNRLSIDGPPADKDSDFERWLRRGR